MKAMMSDLASGRHGWTFCPRPREGDVSCFQTQAIVSEVNYVLSLAGPRGVQSLYQCILPQGRGLVEDSAQPAAGHIPCAFNFQHRSNL